MNKIKNIQTINKLQNSDKKVDSKQKKDSIKEPKSEELADSNASQDPAMAAVRNSILGAKKVTAKGRTKGKFHP